MALLSKAAILAASDLQMETIAVPEWGGEVGIRNLMGWERDRWDNDYTGKDKDGLHIRAGLVAASLCDDSGKSLDFTEADVLALSHKSARPLDRLFAACLKLSGIGKQDVEEMEKNSPGQNGNSG